MFVCLHSPMNLVLVSPPNDSYIPVIDTSSDALK
jgi:hypothetical protein